MKNETRRLVDRVNDLDARITALQNVADAETNPLKRERYDDFLTAARNADRDFEKGIVELAKRLLKEYREELDTL